MEGIANTLLSISYHNIKTHLDILRSRLKRLKERFRLINEHLALNQFQQSCGYPFYQHVTLVLHSESWTYQSPFLVTIPRPFLIKTPDKIRARLRRTWVTPALKLQSMLVRVAETDHHGSRNE
ncbi:hypothetical protein NC653_039171 [Populus alba x Populus x berolinensis]|uniref:Uncharacterized protein n=1 Tax=Populus alba x Populus x berolinensis TaxID=444605 RepID=A0AAD6PRT6_9ROSI|nr:hypothetical protein NC653_039171 [Populus alba x Populus x berolinensis]